MKVTQIPKRKLDYDPFEFDCCGSHIGESIEIELENGITLHVQQIDSGIGPSWTVTATHPDKPIPDVKFHTFVDDEGEFLAYARANDGGL